MGHVLKHSQDENMPNHIMINIQHVSGCADHFELVHSAITDKISYAIKVRDETKFGF